MKTYSARTIGSGVCANVLNLSTLDQIHTLCGFVKNTSIILYFKIIFFNAHTVCLHVFIAIFKILIIVLDRVHTMCVNPLYAL
jgi:hypothetical protein